MSSIWPRLVRTALAHGLTAYRGADCSCYSRGVVQEYEVQGWLLSACRSVNLFTFTQLTFLRDNLLINDHVLHMAHTYKVQKLISCLSTCVFPDQVTYPLNEEKIHIGPPHESNFGYAHAKRMVDVQNQ